VQAPFEFLDTYHSADPYSRLTADPEWNAMIDARIAAARRCGWCLKRARAAPGRLR